MFKSCTPQPRVADRQCYLWIHFPPWKQEKSKHKNNLFNLLPFYHHQVPMNLLTTTAWSKESCSRKSSSTWCHLKNLSLLEVTGLHAYSRPWGSLFGKGLCFHSTRWNNTNRHLMWEVTSTDRASRLLGPCYMATLQTPSEIWANTGGKRYFIMKNLSFPLKVSPKEKEARRLRFLAN